MKRGLILIAAAIQLILSGCGSVLTVNVSNPLLEDRHPELVELELSEVTSRLKLDEDETLIITSNSTEVPYQTTYDGKIVFPAKLGSGASQTFVLRKGTPAEVVTKVRGDHYPNRVDDICWENDLVGFRIYGFKEDNPSGYDIFTKKNTAITVTTKEVMGVFIQMPSSFSPQRIGSRTTGTISALETERMVAVFSATLSSPSMNTMYSHLEPVPMGL